MNQDVIDSIKTSVFNLPHQINVVFVFGLEIGSVLLYSLTNDFIKYLRKVIENKNCKDLQNS